MDVEQQRVNFDSYTFSVSDNHNMFVRPQHKLQPGVQQHRVGSGAPVLLPILRSFNPLSRGLDERGSHFRLGKKKLIKQDALTTHAQ